ncbi:MAG: acyl-CoA/acyl-ACP dehydrogenase [Pseudomonadales bacterium]|nr:acyl-CoA/acyl-ACP dehydrogenase [Pseudomonadales bacterium]
MEFSFTEEQQMIRDTAESFLQDVSTSEAIRKAMATEDGYDPGLWQQICADLYFQAITIPEEFGGMGLGFVELVAVFEQMGRFLLCAPYFSTVGLAANALLVAANAEQQAEYFPRILEGKTASLAYTGTSGKWDAATVDAVYKKEGDSYVLNGEYRYVIDGHTADFLIVAARQEGTLGEEGLGLFIMPANSVGVERNWLPTMDQTRKQASVVLKNVSLSASALMSENAWPQLQKIIQLAQICLAAEQAGGTQQILDMTVEYTKERVQFNRPIASFQAIKHKAADMMLKAEVAKSAIYYAACVAQEAVFNGDEVIASELPEASAMAKAHCSDSYFFNAGNAIQMFGGVGFTWEYDVHLYFKRAKSSELLFGNGAWHREQIAQILLG